MRGLALALSSASLMDVYAHNDIENTFDILSLSVSNSMKYLFQIPKNMGDLETFLSGKKASAPLSNPIITTASSGMAASGSTTQETLWASVVVEGVISYIAFEDYGTTQLYETHMMEYRDNDPASCPATTSTIPSENTNAAHEQARSSNCLVDWHLDATGVKTTSFVNKDYDPRARNWYITTKALKVPNWSSLYTFIQAGAVGITYSLPIYSVQTDTASTLLGIIAFDYELGDIENILADNNVDNVVQYIVSASNELVATSVGESKVTSTGAIKLASQASNFIIRESAALLTSTVADGFYNYESATDDSDYIMKVTTYTEDSSLVWKIVMVTEEDHVPEMSVKANIVLADVNAALDDLTQNTESVAHYLKFMAGRHDGAPLSTAIVEDGATASISSVTHDSLWGIMNSFPEVADVMLTYSNKKMYHFHADNTKMYYRDQGASALYNEYALNADGTITGGIVSSTSYDPTASSYYTVATETAAWTDFFIDPSPVPDPEIAFSEPFFSAPYVLDGVISTTIFLSAFEAVLVEFVDPNVVYFILDAQNKLVATSLGETTWDSTAESLIAGSSSTNVLVKTSSAYIANNAINVDNTFILQNDELNLEDMITTVHKYTDVIGLLEWKLVSVQYYDEDVWTGSAAENNDDDDVAAGFAIGLGVVLFLVLASVAAMLVLGKLTFGGAKSEDTTTLAKPGATSSDAL